MELFPYQILPLIQLWATISVLFFYQSFFAKHPLEPQLNNLNKSIERFYEQYQGFIKVPSNNYLSVKWDNFFISIKRMTTLIFFYSIFLLFYLGLYKNNQELFYKQNLCCSQELSPSQELYHTNDIFFLTSTNLYLFLWLSWHLVKPIRKAWKYLCGYIKEKIEFFLQKKKVERFFIKKKSKNYRLIIFLKNSRLEKPTKYIINNVLKSLDKIEECLKKERLESNKAFWSPKEKLFSNNIRLILIYVVIFFFFFIVLLLYFANFENIDSLIFRYYGIKHPFSNVKNPTIETILTSFVLFFIVPIFIYTRIIVDAYYIRRLRRKLLVLPKAEDTYLLLDLLSMPRDAIQKMSSTRVVMDVKKWKGQGDIIDKKDIRNYLQYKADLVISILAKSFLDIESDNPIRGQRFTQNQEFQLEKIFKKQIDSSYERILDTFSHIDECQSKDSQNREGIKNKSKLPPKEVSKMLNKMNKELIKVKKQKNKNNNRGRGKTDNFRCY